MEPTAGQVDAVDAVASPATGPGRGQTPALRRLRYAAETRRLYAADWAGFATWCRLERHAALPAAPASVATYLASLSASLGPGALSRCAAAIAARHRHAGHASPATDAAVRDVLQAARMARRAAAAATRGPGDVPAPRRPTRRPPPPTPLELARMAARCPGDLAGLRDRALLLLSAAGVGGERLLALDREHVNVVGRDLALALPGIGGGEAEVVIVARSALPLACPVRALDDWLRGSDTAFGPVFRKVDRWGTVAHDRLRADALRRIFNRRTVPVRTTRRTGKAAA
ncbi:hypothetical protein [Lichenicoccus sp.]|uniref:hypothetical protein n=1 Tax=Lichenicoccus sp. TaxID=2781899 RepID=UPI003D150C4D